MKHIIIVLTLTCIFASCTSIDNAENVEKESSNIETAIVDETSTKDENLKPIDTDEALIATALMAAPKESRAGCKVIGYNLAGEFVTLKEGDNEFICLADNPNQKGFSAACYHKGLDPFMARGRELRAEGKSSKEVFDIREAEVKSGKLEMGKPGSTLHIYFGSEKMYNPETSTVSGAKYRYVSYIPWATAESTGLPESPIASNHPWIMNPGTHKAHIMISPIN